VRIYGIACPNYYVLTVQAIHEWKNYYFKENVGCPNYMRVRIIWRNMEHSNRTGVRWKDSAELWKLPFLYSLHRCWETVFIWTNQIPKVNVLWRCRNSWHSCILDTDLKCNVRFQMQVKKITDYKNCNSLHSSLQSVSTSLTFWQLAPVPSSAHQGWHSHACYDPTKDCARCRRGMPFQPSSGLTQPRLLWPH